MTRLAALRPLADITVADLAAEAGINRATFYSHFKSPWELLVEVLRTDLDQLRSADEELRADNSLGPDVAFARALNSVAEHIQRFSRVYALALGSPRDNAVRHVLGSHFTESVRRRLDQAPDAVPEGNRAIMAGYIGQGVVGAVEAWLLGGEMDREELIRTVQCVTPEWWYRT